MNLLTLRALIGVSAGDPLTFLTTVLVLIIGHPRVCDPRTACKFKSIRFVALRYE
jgi:hypothetical protein